MRIDAQGFYGKRRVRAGTIGWGMRVTVSCSSQSREMIFSIDGYYYYFIFDNI